MDFVGPGPAYERWKKDARVPEVARGDTPYEVVGAARSCKSDDSERVA